MIVGCPVCNSDFMTLVYEDLIDYLTGDKFSIRQCSKCSLASTFPRPLESEKYYPTRYREYGWLVKNVLKIFYSLRVFSWLRSNNSTRNSPGSVLEVGCGTGDMLLTFLRKGWIVAGTERNPEMSRAAKLKGINVYSEGFESIPDSNRFDLIIFFQVLEHLEDPAEALSFAKNHLAEDGRIIIAVPNFSGLQSRLFGSSWFHLDVPRHLSHFSLQSLEFIVRREGLEIARTGFFSPEHDPYGLFQSVLNKFVGDNGHFTRMLMGIDPFLIRDCISCVIGVLMCPVFLVFLLSGIFFKNGPVIQVEVIKSGGF